MDPYRYDLISPSWKNMENDKLCPVSWDLFCNAGEPPIKFQSNQKTINLNSTALRLQDLTWKELELQKMSYSLTTVNPGTEFYTWSMWSCDPSWYEVGWGFMSECRHETFPLASHQEVRHQECVVTLQRLLTLDRSEQNVLTSCRRTFPCIFLNENCCKCLIKCHWSLWSWSSWNWQ